MQNLSHDMCHLEYPQKKKYMSITEEVDVEVLSSIFKPSFLRERTEIVIFVKDALCCSGNV